MNSMLRRSLALLGLCLGCAGAPVMGQTSGADATPARPAPTSQAKRNLAPGFEMLPKGATIALLPVDVELFSMSAGGVLEPKADWTAAAQTHMRAAIEAKKTELKLRSVSVDEKSADEFADQVALHAAVAQSVSLHHSSGGLWALPSKEGVLSWNLGDAMKPIQARTGARYGLFVWMRDSYASAERKAAIVLMAVLGVGLTGGVQVGYASLVDLETGQLLWFNRLVSGTGDLREATPARSSIDALFSGFPTGQ